MSRPINIHSLKFEDISFEDIQDFCKQKITENIQLDYKKELPNKLSKHLAAFSNTRGGVIIIGVEEDSETGEPVKWDGVKKDDKLIEQVWQHASNVIQFPTIRVRFTNVKNQKAFLLISIAEGGSPPYHTNSDPTIWIRTGNVSTPLDKIRRDELDRLYEKKTRALKLRKENSEMAQEIYRASLARAENERKKYLRSEPEQKTIDKPLGESSTTLAIEIQPFYPEKEITSRRNTKSKISDYRATGPFSDYPNLASEQCPGGISYFNWSRYEGYFESQIIFSNGLLFTAKDIRRKHEGRPTISLNVLTGILARQLRVASNFYNIFGYSGVLSGRITLDKLLGVRVYDLCPSGYHRLFDDGSVNKIDTDSWEIANLDTHRINEENSFIEIIEDTLSDVFWDLGQPTPDREKILTFLKKDLGYFHDNH